MKYIIKIRIWVLNRLFWRETRVALESRAYWTHLMRAGSLLQQRQQLINQLQAVD